jgi:hypothetical protein
MAEKYHDQEFIEYVVKTLVEKPEAVVVKRSVDEMGVLLELTVDKEDMGVVIGKEGRTAKALRTLLRVLGAKSDSRINLKIVDPEGSEPREPRKEAPVVEGEQAESIKEEKVEPVKEVEAAEEVAEEELAVAEEPAEDEDARPMADLEI